jgi:hypothetical protein
MIAVASANGGVDKTLERVDDGASMGRYAFPAN